MSKVFASLGMSLDGFIAGPDARPDNPLGDGGMRIHEWVFGVEGWRERQSIGGGQTNQDDDIVRENFSRAGAYIMGRQMFAEGEAGWPDPPPFRAPVFVLTHTPREPWVRQGGTTFTFVTEGIDSALARARQAAGGKDIQISGGADTYGSSSTPGCWTNYRSTLRPSCSVRASGSSTASHLASTSNPHGWSTPPRSPTSHTGSHHPRAWSLDGEIPQSRVLAQLQPVVPVHSAPVPSSSGSGASGQRSGHRPAGRGRGPDHGGARHAGRAGGRRRGGRRSWYGGRPRAACRPRPARDRTLHPPRAGRGGLPADGLAGAGRRRDTARPGRRRWCAPGPASTGWPASHGRAPPRPTRPPSKPRAAGALDAALYRRADVDTLVGSQEHPRPAGSGRTRPPKGQRSPLAALARGTAAACPLTARRAPLPRDGRGARRLPGPCQPHHVHQAPGATAAHIDDGHLSNGTAGTSPPSAAPTSQCGHPQKGRTAMSSKSPTVSPGTRPSAAAELGGRRLGRDQGGEFVQVGVEGPCDAHVPLGSPHRSLQRSHRACRSLTAFGWEPLNAPRSWSRPGILETGLTSDPRGAVS